MEREEKLITSMIPLWTSSHLPVENLCSRVWDGEPGSDSPTHSQGLSTNG